MDLFIPPVFPLLIFPLIHSWPLNYQFFLPCGFFSPPTEAIIGMWVWRSPLINNNVLLPDNRPCSESTKAFWEPQAWQECFYPGIQLDFISTECSRNLLPFCFGQLVHFYQFVQDGVACQTKPVVRVVFSTGLSWEPMYGPSEGGSVLELMWNAEKTPNTWLWLWHKPEKITSCLRSRKIILFYKR